MGILAPERIVIRPFHDLRMPIKDPLVAFNAEHMFPSASNHPDFMQRQQKMLVEELAAALRYPSQCTEPQARRIEI